jgi:hypothetical protein
MNISGFHSLDFYEKDTPGSLKLLVLFSAILDIVVEVRTIQLYLIFLGIPF